MRPPWVVLLLAVLGCERPGIKPIAGELVVTPGALAFEPTFVGFPRDGEVVIGNRSRASRSLTVSITGPFSTTSEVVAAGGADTALTVTFAPSAAGEATGTLTVADEGETLVIALSGTGLQPLVCSSSVCETNRFAPELGRCVAEQAADGTSCSNACLSTGMCSSGRCIGTPVDCSDSDPCTLDACDPASGCLHPPAQCAAPTNPCKAARCDPSLGCVESDVRDGTACGESDCVTAQVCIAGMCKGVAAPDGASCGSATPCQGAGMCQQQVCVRPPGGQLTEAWSYDFPSMQASFTGVSDTAENLYWMECAFGGLGEALCDACMMCGVTSYTRDGALRFRKGLFGVDPNAPLHHLLAGDSVIYAAHSSVGALSTIDGAERWQYFLGINPTGIGDVADDGNITSLAATPTAITLTLARSQAQSSRRSGLFQLDVVTGAIVFAKFYDGFVSAPVVDESGAITFLVTPWYSPNPLPPPSYLVSLSPSGVERWRVTSPTNMPWQLANPAAVYAGELQLEDGELRSMADGSLLVPAPSGTLTSNPLMGVLGRVLLRTPQSATQVNAISLRPGVQTPSWEVLVHQLHGSNSLSDTVATSSGGFLVAAGDSRHPNTLKGFSDTGVERFSCEIPWNEYGETPATLLDRRWVALQPRYLLTPKLHVYEVGAEFPARRGWTGKRGSASGANRPLP